MTGDRDLNFYKVQIADKNTQLQAQAKRLAEAAARIEELESDHAKLRRAVAACCVGWDASNPPHGEAIVAALRRALGVDLGDEGPFLMDVVIEGESHSVEYDGTADGLYNAVKRLLRATQEEDNE